MKRFLVYGLVCLPFFVHADLWLPASNYKAKADLQFLSAHGIITAPITTYPLAWQSILSELQLSDEHSIAEQQAISRLLNEYEKSNKIQISARIATEEYALPVTADRFNDRSSLFLRASYNGEKVHAKFSADLINGRISGSYIALEYSNWLFYLAANEQFWGPGNDASLIYSNYSQPTPTIGLQRASAQAFDLPVLNLIGPWSFKAQMAQLESNRAVPDALFWSARFNFKPLSSLEIGFSHVSLWGGDGYGNSLSDFADIITGEEFCVNGESTCDKSDMTKFGNQLAAIDINFQLKLFAHNFNLYAQTTGEDAPTDSILPADKVNMFGLSSLVPTNFGLVKVYLESIDSNLSCGGEGSTGQNCLYEHGTYRSGYRYRGIPIGSPYDNDSTSLVLGLSLTSDKHFVQTKIRELSLNEDNSNRSGFGGHYLVEGKTELTIVEYIHQYDWSETQQVNLEIQSKVSGSLPNEDDHILTVGYSHIF